MRWLETSWRQSSFTAALIFLSFYVHAAHPARLRAHGEWHLKTSNDIVVGGHSRRHVAGSERYVIVVSRFDEDLDWLLRIPEFYEIVVFNKGGELPQLLQTKAQIIPIANYEFGRETDTYVAYILANYDNLPDKVVFTQGDPFTHSPHFFYLLFSPQLWQSFQPMSLLYKENIPPKSVIDSYQNTPWWRVERMSTRTLDSVYFHDPGVDLFATDYLKGYGLPLGTNIMHHHLESIGCSSLPPEQEVISFVYSAIFSVDSSLIMRHPKELYAKLLEKTGRNSYEGYIAERAWMLLFDPVAAMQTPLVK